MSLSSMIWYQYSTFRIFYSFSILSFRFSRPWSLPSPLFGVLQNSPLLLLSSPPFLSLPSFCACALRNSKKIPNKSSGKEVATSISSAAKVDPEAPGPHPADPSRGRGRGDPAPRAPKGLSVGSKRFYLGRVGSPVIDRASANQNSPFLPLPCQRGASVTDPPPAGFREPE